MTDIYKVFAAYVLEINQSQIHDRLKAEFQEFEPRLKFEPRLEYGWFYLKVYSIFQDLSRCSIETGFWKI